MVFTVKIKIKLEIMNCSDRRCQEHRGTKHW